MSSWMSRSRPTESAYAYNLATLRSNFIAELAGSLGDLGTLLPLLIALTLSSSISLSTTLVFTGLANVLTGLFFGLPLPVQPMKAIAAVAIAQNFSKEKSAAAGIFVSAVIAASSIVGVLDWLGRVIPIPVVKGIQVGAGLSLVLSAGSTLLRPLGWAYPGSTDNLLWALAAFLLLLATLAVTTGPMRVSALPYALIVFVLGIILVMISPSSPSTDGGSVLEIWRPQALSISWPDFLTGALTAGIGQLPLTTLNSIIAVTHLSAELLPSRPEPTPRALGLSVAAMNLIGCAFGAMPSCHGSGGLAAQYRFGARSGASIVILGLVKMALGLFFGETWLVGVLERFPKSLLGIMVIAAGLELAKVGASLNVGAKDLWEASNIDVDTDDQPSAQSGKQPRQPDEKEREHRWTVMMFTVAGLLAFKNDAVGFVAGLLCHWTFHAGAWWASRRASHHSWLQGQEEQEDLFSSGEPAETSR